MDNKKYIWLFNNIGKYNFDGNEASQIKESISRMLITEDSVNMPEIVAKMEGYYTQLVNSFYNNVIGYQNGLADKNITSADMDCYFISTSEGMVPIGYYRSSRPAEAASLVQRYLDECKDNIKNEKNKLIIGWQSKVDDVSKKYGEIKESKNPNLLKAICGTVVAIAILVMVISSFVKMDIDSFFTNMNDAYVIEKTAASLPILSGAEKSGIITFIVCLIVAFAVAIILGLFVAKEIKLLKDKKTTDNVLKNILNYVTGMEHGIADNMSAGTETLYVAARQGNTTEATRNKNTVVIANIRKNIETASNFANKTEQERTGIKNAILVVAIIVALLLPLTYTNLIPNWAESIELQKQQQAMNNTNSTNNSNGTSTSTNSNSGNNQGANEYEISFDESRDYIYPSNKEYITKEQLDKLTKDEIALLRNEIYARHGYEFQLQQYKDYFNKKSWYRPSSSFDESMFNSIEKANKDLIVEYEIEKGWR